MTFEKLCKVFLIQEPFYGIILSSMDKIPTNKIDTLGVGKSGNTFKLWYNPDFISKFDDDTVCQLLKHECLHLCLQHPFISEHKGIHSPQMHKLYNIACDLEVNCYLDRNKMQKEVGGQWVEDYKLDTNLGSIAYFEELLKHLQPQDMDDQNAMMPCNGGKGEGLVKVMISESKNGNGFKIYVQLGDKIIEVDSVDDHSVWPKDASEAMLDQLRNEVDAMVAFAAEETEKHQGTIPGEMQGRIDRIKKKPKPVTDWKKYCRRFLGNEYTYLTKKSRRRESMRFPDAAGTRHLRKARILVAIDTSGSVSMPEYREFMGQIITMKEKANFRILECDAQIQYEYEFNGKVHENLHGGGGTSFEPVVDYFIANKKEYDCLVYFTDGYCNIPSNTPKDTLWVVSSKGDHNREKYKVNGCSSVFIPKQNEQ